MTAPARLPTARRAACLALAAFALAVPWNLPASGAKALDSTCTDPRGGLDPGCLPAGTAGQLVRQVCGYTWQEAFCPSTAFEDPGYVAVAEPGPDRPLGLRVGAVHEHSSYSDGDPQMIPGDYYRAARTGHNSADAGGDTGVKLDFMFGSEHSDNAEIPFTTAEACIDPNRLPMGFVACQHVAENDDYWKWPAELRQAHEATERTASGDFSGFTAIRGFEWTNDYYNHLNVYFSTNFTNVKVDGSYTSMDVFWDWLREPVAQGGGADALVTFNHPGGNPALSPFDGDLPHNQVLAAVPGGGNWNDVAYVPDVDPRMAAMEVNGGDDIEWYVKALTKGWHIGAVANEDEHQREWSSSQDGKTLLLTRGRSYHDYYWALQQHRSIAVTKALVTGSPGTMATTPTIHFYAGGSGPSGTGIQDGAATVLGGTRRGAGPHTLHVEAAGLPVGSRVALVSNTGGGQRAPVALGAVSGTGVFTAAHQVQAPASGESWWFAVVCPAEAGAACGSDQRYSAVTAPIWFRA